MAMNERSKKRLATCHPDLIEVITELSKTESIQVIEGHRTIERQKELIAQGKSSLKNPENGKHTQTPSLAVDIAPLKDGKVDWNDIESFKRLNYKIQEIAKSKNKKISWGGNWKTFKDYVHFEIV